MNDVTEGHPDDRLIASMVANSGLSRRQIAEELGIPKEQVREMARRGSAQRTLND